MINKPVFAIAQTDEETIQFFVNGEEIGSANHDEEGWKGMQAMEDLFTSIAYKLGIKVQTIEPPDSEE